MRSDRWIAAIVMIVMCLGFASGCEQNPVQGNPAPVTDVKLSTPTAASKASPAAPGVNAAQDEQAKRLVQERCTVCHTTAKIDAKKADYAEWSKIIDRMISHGAKLTPEEQKIVAQHLAKK